MLIDILNSHNCYVYICFFLMTSVEEKIISLKMFHLKLLLLSLKI